MDAAARRAAILSVLERADHPVSAAALAREFSVSRQIIVGDVALLRAGGLAIAATPRGYMLPEERNGLIRTLACRHRVDQMETELNAIVDQGCTVIDVIVEHPIYGQLTGPLQLSSRYDVAQFVARCRQADALPLSTSQRASTCIPSPVRTRPPSSGCRPRWSDWASCWRSSPLGIISRPILEALPSADQAEGSASVGNNIRKKRVDNWVRFVYDAVCRCLDTCILFYKAGVPKWKDSRHS